MLLSRLQTNQNAEGFSICRFGNASPTLLKDFLSLNVDRVDSFVEGVCDYCGFRCCKRYAERVELSTANEEKRFNLVGYRFDVAVVASSDLSCVIDFASVTYYHSFSGAD